MGEPSEIIKLLLLFSVFGWKEDLCCPLAIYNSHEFDLFGSERCCENLAIIFVEQSTEKSKHLDKVNVRTS